MVYGSSFILLTLPDLPSHAQLSSFRYYPCDIGGQVGCLWKYYCGSSRCPGSSGSLGGGSPGTSSSQKGVIAKGPVNRRQRRTTTTKYFHGMPELWFVFSLVERTFLLFLWKRNIGSQSFVFREGKSVKCMLEKGIICHTVSQMNVVSVGEINR